jgi:DNA-directed RNA polymerase subunit RPC12/RpoP
MKNSIKHDGALRMKGGMSGAPWQQGAGSAASAPPQTYNYRKSSTNPAPQPSPFGSVVQAYNAQANPMQTFPTPPVPGQEAYQAQWMQYQQQMFMYAQYMQSQQDPVMFGDPKKSTLAAYGNRGHLPSNESRPYDTRDRRGNDRDGRRNDNRGERRDFEDRRGRGYDDKRNNNNNNREGEGVQFYRKNRPFDPNMQQLPLDPNLKCDNCDKCFTKLATYETHKKAHIKCRHCDFEALAKVVALHIESAHPKAAAPAQSSYI